LVVLQGSPFSQYSRNFFMSHINRAAVQIPAFFVITGTIVIANVLSQPEPTPKKDTRQPPPRIVLEHAPEGMGGVRGDLQKFKLITKQPELGDEQSEESHESFEETGLTPT
jgi:hypothetical protein